MHCSKLKKGTHSKKVQEEYAKYSSYPELEILVECTKVELNRYEDECIEIWDSANNGLNSMKSALSSPKGIQSCENHPNNKYSPEQYELALFLLVEGSMSHREIADKIKISKQVIDGISRGNSQIWLKNKYPEEYDKMLKTRPGSGNGHRLFKTRPLLQAPNGTIYNLSGKNVTAFAKEHGLEGGKLSEVLNGYPNSHKGWKIFKDQD